MTAPGKLRINILGSLEFWDGDRRLRLGGPVQERVVVSLLLEFGQVLPVSRLVEAVWDEEPPATAAHQVRKAVAKLRKALPGGAELIVTDGAGYRAVLGQTELDLSLFSAYLQSARQAAAGGMADDAVHDLESALALWRGPVLSGAGGPVIDAASAALEERRLSAVEQAFDLRLARGDTAELVGDLRELVAAHPLREVLWGQLMLALFQSGRQAEALEEHARVRRLLSEELGVDPGDGLTHLYESILRNDPALAAPEPREPALAEVPPLVGSCTLPHDLRDFTGRERELTSLLRYAGEPDALSSRIVAIDGMGGSGKTSLAVHAAHKLVECYPDAQLYVDLHGFTPGEEPLSAGVLAESLLRMLGVSGEHIPDETQGRIASWRAMAGKHRLLLLLDDARAAAQVLPLLPASSNSLVLITSRSRLIDLDGAHWISLGMMTPQDSTALVAETLGKARVAAEPDATAALAELCGHLPLALRIASARLRNRPRWTIDYLVDRLGNESRRLDELSSGERSVRLTLKLSYEGLDAEHRVALRLLGRHPGYAIDVHSAAALLGATVGAAEEVLENLLDTHLLQQNQIGYYSFHDLVRSFAQWLGDRYDGVALADGSPGGDPVDGDTDQYDSTGDDSPAVRRLLDYYLTATNEVCDLLFPGRVGVAADLPRSTSELPPLRDADRAREWLAREQPCLRGAIALAERSGLHRHTADLARNVVFQLDSSGQFEQFREVSRIAVDASRLLDDHARLRLSLSNLAVADWRLGRLEEGIAAATQALDLAVELGDRRGEAKDTGLLGLLLATLGRFGEALPRLERSIALKQKLGAVRAEAESLTNLSSLYEQWGRCAEAVEAARAAVELNHRLGARENEIVALSDLAVASLGLGDVEQARACLERARAIIGDVGSPGDVALVLALSATVCQELDQPEQAAAFAERALTLGRSSRMPIREAVIENTVGRLRRLQGQPAAALTLHGNAQRVASAIGFRVEEARALDGLAEAYDALGDTALSLEFRARANALFDVLGVPTPRSASAQAAATQATSAQATAADRCGTGARGSD
jgi:DNA-binding SARP family transcriptional activator